MKPSNGIPGIQHLLSLPPAQNRNCEEPVKGQARSRDSLWSPLTEPSQFQSNRNYGSERRKPKYHSLRPDGVNMCPQSQPCEPNGPSGQSVIPGPFEAERPIWLTAAEAAVYLKMKVRTILLWARQGRVKAFALTGTQRRVWRFLQADLDAIVIQKKPVVSSAQPSVLANERRI